LCRLNGKKTAVGVVYFPNDWVDKTATDKLFYELLENCALFKSHGYEICLAGDFNGRCLQKCDVTGKSIQSRIKQSYNGGRLLRFVDAAELNIANALSCSQGFFTRIINDQRSAIDYIFLSNKLTELVCSVIIDDSGIFDLHSDHVVLNIKFKESFRRADKFCNVSGKSMKILIGLCSVVT